MLEPASVDGALQATLAQASGLRLELERRAWLRLGRDVVGQRTTVAVAKNRYGPPGRSVDLDIHYLPDGERAVATHRLASDGAAGWPSAPTSAALVTPVLSPAGLVVPDRERPRPRLVVV